MHVILFNVHQSLFNIKCSLVGLQTAPHFNTCLRTQQLCCIRTCSSMPQAEVNKLCDMS